MNEINAKPLVDILSTQLGRQVVMSGEDYVYLSGGSVALSDVTIALATQAKELAVLQALRDEEEASILRDTQMSTGVDYNGLMISLTDVDGNGLLQVKAGFEMGLTNTTIHFKNGTKLPMTAEEFPAFALWFVTERNRFFV